MRSQALAGGASARRRQQQHHHPQQQQQQRQGDGLPGSPSARLQTVQEAASAGRGSGGRLAEVESEQWGGGAPCSPLSPGPAVPGVPSANAFGSYDEDTYSVDSSASWPQHGWLEERPSPRQPLQLLPPLPGQQPAQPEPQPGSAGAEPGAAAGEATAPGSSTAGAAGPGGSRGSGGGWEQQLGAGLGSEEDEELVMNPLCPLYDELLPLDAAGLKRRQLSYSVELLQASARCALCAVCAMAVLRALSGLDQRRPVSQRGQAALACWCWERGGLVGHY